MNFNFSWKITLTSIVLACSMLALSRWQWHRHLEKQELIATLRARLELPVVPVQDLRDEMTSSPASLSFRRVALSGTYDFAHEVILRNRRNEGWAGVHAITPLRLDNSDTWILVDRGFIPLGREKKDVRKRYQSPETWQGFGLLKESVPPKFLGPADPPAGPGHPWVDEWLRVTIDAMQKQLPYQVLPLYAEIMNDPNDPLVEEKIVRESTGGREDMLTYTSQKPIENFGMDSPDTAYPIPVFDTTTPPDIHLGYVYEWAFLAALTLGIAAVMQMKRGVLKTNASSSNT